MNRQVPLVEGNESLRAAYTAAQTRGMTRATILADFVWSGCRVVRIDFRLLASRLRGTVHEPDDFSMTVIPDPSDSLGGVVPERPPAESLRPHSPRSLIPITHRPTDMIGLLRRGLEYILKNYWRSIQAGYEIARFKGKAVGFADSLAVMASTMPPNADRPSFPTCIPDRERQNEAHGNRAALRGYREGCREAIAYVRRHEETRVPGQPYPSAALMLWLQGQYGPTRREIRLGLLNDYVPERNWEGRQFYEQD